MFFNMKVLLVSILFSASLALSSEVPTKREETFSDFLLPGSQLMRRNAELDINGHYDAAYKLEDPKWPPLRGETFESQRRCRCPQEPRRGRWHEYPPQRGYGYGGSGRGTRYSPYGGSYRYVYGYPSRMRDSSWWFDERDDYPDDILVYRFYNGGIRPSIGKVENIPEPIEYKIQQGSSGDEAHGEGSVVASTSGMHGYALQYQSYNPDDSNNYRSSSSKFQSQGARPIGTASSNPRSHEFLYSEEESEHSLYSEVTEYELNDRGSPESASVEHGGYPVTQDNGSKPKGKVRTFRYWGGIWEDRNGDEKTTPQTVMNPGSITRTEEFLFGTPTPRSPRAGGYRHDDCCYQRRGGYNGRGYRRNRKPINFFGISWSRLLEYSDVTDEVDSGEKSIRLDIEKDRKQVVTNNDEQVTVVGKESTRKEAETEEYEEVTEKST